MKLDEKGLTLVEILAALTIAGFVTTVAFMTFSGINLEFSSSTDKYLVESEAKMTLNSFERILSGSSEYSFLENEWRFSYFDPAISANRVKVFYYHDNILTLYDAGPVSNYSDWKADSITYPGSFEGHVLANHLLEAPAFQDLSEKLISISIRFAGIDQPYKTSIKLLNY